MSIWAEIANALHNDNKRAAAGGAALADFLQGRMDDADTQVSERAR